MITAIVNFPLGDGVTRDKAAQAFRDSAPRYRDVPGLVRKYYLYDDEQRTGGGVYLFESREAAEAAFDDTWRGLIRERYGADPELRLFETPVIVDNAAGENEEAA